MAKALNKPFYVVAESFKFVRLYPLKQDDVRNIEKVRIQPGPLAGPHTQAYQNLAICPLPVHCGQIAISLIRTHSAFA